MGDSALVVDILVTLINTLGLTELVSDALACRKQKEAETNAKIVDLFKDALARVCVVEDTDPTPVDQISWCKVVRAPSRPYGQKTNLLSQHHQGFGIVT